MRRRRKAGADWADDFALRGGRTADFLRLYIIGQYLLYQYLFYYYLFVCDFPTSDFPTAEFPTPDFQTAEAGGFFALPPLRNIVVLLTAVRITPCFFTSAPRFIVHRTRFGASPLRNIVVLLAAVRITPCFFTSATRRRKLRITRTRAVLCFVCTSAHSLRCSSFPQKSLADFSGTPITVHRTRFGASPQDDRSGFSVLVAERRGRDKFNAVLIKC